MCAITGRSIKPKKIKKCKHSQGWFDCDSIVTSGCVMDEKVPELE